MSLPIHLYPADAVADAPALLRLGFGDNPPAGAIDHPGLLPLSHAGAVETWGDTAPARSGRQGNLYWADDDTCLCGHVHMPLGTDVAGTTRTMYEQLLAFINASAFPHLVRIWNFLPRINVGRGDQEIYRQFCVGRAQAFDTHPCAAEALPAGTAIGTHHNNTLLVYFIAARRPGRQIENPRQVSAFDYPRQYSPRKPLFSRATVWTGARGARLLVSGTASIVGHASRHPDDLQAQLAELWHNLESLRQAAGATHPIAMRVYIRHRADYPTIRAFVAARTPSNMACLYLLADICRAELLVEIEGVYAMSAEATGQPR